jgi:predicted metal-dependent hydrolase
MQFELFREDYRLREKLSPKARNIRVEVRPGREVVLVYPRWVPRSEALAFLRSRGDWIREKISEMEQHAAENPPPPPARWDGTDELLLRGETVPVCIEPASLRRPSVRFESHAPAALREQPHKLELALKRELMHLAQVEARRALDEEAARLDVRYADLRINDPQTLWGSCNPGGVICLSWRLIMAPPEVFRYVVVHELCHLVQANHSQRFWRLVERQMPGYEPHKRWLRDRGQQLHHYLPRRPAGGAGH